jgi:hypothetical protein
MRSKFKWILTLLIALSMQFSFAQQKTVSGVVSDSSGPVPGVNVVVKGTRVVYRLIWMAVILLKRKLEMI